MIYLTQNYFCKFTFQEKRREDFNFAKKENLEKKKLLQARKEAHATQMLKMKQVVFQVLFQLYSDSAVRNFQKSYY